MELALILVSDYANTTAEGKLNVMGIFGNITATGFPTTHPEMYVIAQLMASPAEYNLSFRFELKLIDEEAQEIGHITSDAVVPELETGRSVRLNHILRLVNITFPRPGDYEFVVLVDGEAKGNLTIEVTQTPAEPSVS